MINSTLLSVTQRSLWTTDDIRHKVEQSKIVVFAKGTSEKPGCGYSERLISAVEKCGRPYEVVNVYEDRSIIPALTAYAGHQSLPLVYANGSLVSSSDTQERLMNSGELTTKLEDAFKQ